MPPVDPELKQALTRVFLVGGSIATVSFSLLYVAFRSFGAERKPGSELRIVLLLSAVVFVIILSCIILLRFSAPK